MSSTPQASGEAKVPESEVKAAMQSIRKQGPCAFCGGPYAAHRLIDGFRGMLAAGESLAEVAKWYDHSESDVLARIAALDRLVAKAPRTPHNGGKPNG